MTEHNPQPWEPIEEALENLGGVADLDSRFREVGTVCEHRDKTTPRIEIAAQPSVRSSSDVDPVGLTAGENEELLDDERASPARPGRCGGAALFSWEPTRLGRDCLSAPTERRAELNRRPPLRLVLTLLRFRAASLAWQPFR